MTSLIAKSIPLSQPICKSLFPQAPRWMLYSRCCKLHIHASQPSISSPVMRILLGLVAVSVPFVSVSGFKTPKRSRADRQKYAMVILYLTP